MNNSGCARVMAFIFPFVCIFMIGYLIIGSYVTYNKMQTEQREVIAEGIEYTASIKKSDSFFAKTRGVDNALLEKPSERKASNQTENTEKSGSIFDKALGVDKAEEERKGSKDDYVKISIDKKVLNELVGESGEGTITAYYSNEYPDVYATQESLDCTIKLTNRFRVIMWIAIIIFAIVAFFFLLAFIGNRSVIRQRPFR